MTLGDGFKQVAFVKATGFPLRVYWNIYGKNLMSHHFSSGTLGDGFKQVAFVKATGFPLRAYWNIYGKKFDESSIFISV